jgi:NTP pyrophosphatase (non-canonical NTP hydrolase)
MTQEEIIQLILAERQRQNTLHQWGDHTPRLAVLSEELGEVGGAIQGDGSLIEELVQVAAVSIRWLEEL